MLIRVCGDFSKEEMVGKRRGRMGYMVFKISELAASQVKTSRAKIDDCDAGSWYEHVLLFLNMLCSIAREITDGN